MRRNKVLLHTSSNDHNKLINKGEKHKFHICSTSCALIATNVFFLLCKCAKNCNCLSKKFSSFNLTFSFQQFFLLFVCCSYKIQTEDRGGKFVMLLCTCKVMSNKHSTKTFSISSIQRQQSKVQCECYKKNRTNTTRKNRTKKLYGHFRIFHFPFFIKHPSTYS